MRLPIYRHLNQQVKMLGLSPMELGIVCAVFVILSQLLNQVRFGSILVIGTPIGLAILLQFLSKQFDPFYFQKLWRFFILPNGLHRRVIYYPDEISYEPTKKE